MAPSITIGAVILLWRKAATKVIVCHDPSGTVPITLTPFGARPFSRARFVLTAVSSINTSRAGSRKPCSRIQRRRARATSARCRSAACRVFFKGDVVAIEKTPERAAAGSNPLLAQLCNGLLKRQVWMLSNHSQDLGRELFKRRNAPAARLRRGAVIIAPALQPLDRLTQVDAQAVLLVSCNHSRRRAASKSRDGPSLTHVTAQQNALA